MKILTAMYTLRRGGAYDRFLMMVDAFLDRQWEVHCLSLTPIKMEHPLYHNHRLNLSFGGRGGWVTKFMIVFLFPFYSLLIGWREKIDIFVAFGSLYAWLLAIPKWILRRRMVTFVRGNSTFGLMVRGSSGFFLSINKMMEYLGLLFSDRILTNNGETQNEILRTVGKKNPVDVRLLYNNIPPMPKMAQEDASQIRSRFRIPIGAKVLMTAGILNRGKNMEMLIKCLPRIGMDNLFLMIIGDGSSKEDFSYVNELRELARRLGLDHRVIFTGWLEKEELWRNYLAADLFVLPSKGEGMPNVILEALGLGVPCIGSRIPGITDVLRHEELLFDPFDEETLAKKLGRFFSDNEYFNEVHELCRQRKRGFVFDWKEEVFHMVGEEWDSFERMKDARGTDLSRGGGCQSR
jgi:glycosyltransferase involved in cell wall biosynthesis